MVTTRTKTYASVAQSTRTSQKSLLQEVAEVGGSFNEWNEPNVVAAEGVSEPQAGCLPAATQHALSVADSSRIRDPSWEEIPGQNCEKEIPLSDTGDEADSSDNLSVTSIHSQSSSLSPRGIVGWRSTEGGFIMPRNTVKGIEWSAPDRLTNEYKFFPSWFELSQDQDQLGPIPHEWFEKEDKEVWAANCCSLEYANSRGVGAGSQVESMAIIVEVLDDSPAKRNKQPNKARQGGAELQ
ncbi:hypothetical protein GGX14DRAFT_384763 [Mycena pura]|uniref:Uncharacterized protein n=1 Tax=Mycena pura TaxID=153505 RepID=A0AAD6YSE5_9AGAR|nr:hypothetical protein GGX14DRAFT_384763 [Mycena pura]